jgi:hypothetical protein
MITRAARAIDSPSMAIGVRSGCTSFCGSIATRPLTVTRPAAINRVASARDAAPSFDSARASGTPAPALVPRDSPDFISGC